MSTVIYENSITKKQLQEFLKENQENLNWTDDNLKKIIRSLNGKYITREMRFTFYQTMLKLITTNEEDTKGKKITNGERVVIQVLYDAKFHENVIAMVLNKHRSSIMREIRRNSQEIWNRNSYKSPRKHEGQENNKVYDAINAQAKTEERKKNSVKKKKIEKYPKLRRSIEYLIKEHKNSPDVIAYLLKEGKVNGVKEKVCAVTIYKAAKTGKYGFTYGDLAYGQPYTKQGSKHSGKKEKIDRKEDHSIEKLKQEDKESIFYFEGDSIVGKREGSKNTGITLVNKKSQFTFLLRSENKTALATKKTLDRLEEEIENFKDIIKIITFDNGVEFGKTEKLMESINGGERTMIYYAHAYASYERGCNEHKNRMIRRYIPKGTEFEKISDEYLFKIMVILNNMPRKKQGYKTPLEVFEEELKKENIDTKFLDKYRRKKNSWLD